MPPTARKALLYPALLCALAAPLPACDDTDSSDTPDASAGDGDGSGDGDGDGDGSGDGDGNGDGNGDGDGDGDGDGGGDGDGDMPAQPPQYIVPDPADVDLSGVEGDLGDVPTDPRMEGMLAAHNWIRANAVPVPSPALAPLVWSETVAESARQWAATCEGGHDPNNDGEYGENWRSWSAPGSLTAVEVVIGSGWAKEGERYDYASNTCDGGFVLNCGHYTQIVWRDTVEVGCAVQVCPDGLATDAGQKEYWVCRYAPPGNYNFNDNRPY